MDLVETASLFSFVVGEALSAEEMMTAGERIWNLERLFNLREGFTRKDDSLPARLLHEPMPMGPAKGHIVELDHLLQDYYRTRGWDEGGVPTPQKLDKLGLSAEGKTVK
jgi:aldehyde:ferredoxin oxidoreductase